MRLPIFLFLVCLANGVAAQVSPYVNPPEVEPPYYRVRYPASSEEGGLIFPVQYTIWIPEGVTTLRGVVVHQHGCGVGSCLSGQTGAFDLHWQALAKRHDCALLSPSYEQPEGADCQRWCDPRNGSDQAFQQGLVDLGSLSGHPELSRVPWALWGHSGGGHWVGGMTLLHPDRVAATWLRSGVPGLSENQARPHIRPHSVPTGALSVPMMANLGVDEGVASAEGRFALVWPETKRFFESLREQGALIGVSIDPLTSHQCGNQRYLAIPWLDACLRRRLPESPEESLRPMPQEDVWLAPLLGAEAKPIERFDGAQDSSVWLPTPTIARAWMEYTRDTDIGDATPPPSPSAVTVTEALLSWTADADLESGLAQFIILRDGEEIARVPEEPANRYGRPLFQGLQYSDTPVKPLAKMEYLDTGAVEGTTHEYEVIAVNTVGARSVRRR